MDAEPMTEHNQPSESVSGVYLYTRNRPLIDSLDRLYPRLVRVPNPFLNSGRALAHGQRPVSPLDRGMRARGGAHVDVLLSRSVEESTHRMFPRLWEGRRDSTRHRIAGGSRAPLTM